MNCDESMAVIRDEKQTAPIGGDSCFDVNLPF
jgi:hypothetical protein